MNDEQMSEGRYLLHTEEKEENEEQEEKKAQYVVLCQH